MSRMRSLIVIGAAALGLAAVSAPVLGQAVSQIHFARGNDNASVRGTITGRQYRDYKLAVGNGRVGFMVLNGGDDLFDAREFD